VRPLSWETEALEEIVELGRRDRRQAARIVDAAKRFARDGAGDIRALQGMPGRLRLRVGDWRVIIDVQGERYVVAEVVNRRDAYE
jgi:mRNA-degrading endonuclease RelE of RelBE toxin-antitoxin system